MVGWAIEQGKAVTTQEGKQEVVEVKESLRGVFHGRSCQNWGLLLFFVKKVGLEIVIITPKNLVNQGNSHFHYLGAKNTYRCI